MSGGSITCGTFTGRDKSGASFEAVICASLDGSKLIDDITTQLETQDYVLVTADQAGELLPLLQIYRAGLVAEIGHSDWWKAVQDEAPGMDPVSAKWGASNGWRLYCTEDLIEACNTALSEAEPVCIAFD
ncbi:hypothetical protein HU751_007490 [Pseudomonas sp. BW13M1]|uniref:Uncharacterized protein n=1 Tax=Pseudomonas peradeniyensis TaxID=2745488 RepID=A0A923GDK3_9PSED|nr:hypothetical protein [Pseudomonas peradeniyensis]MBV4504689.1 hypothetical protein [Pseudomonas peradeniyensis]